MDIIDHIDMIKESYIEASICSQTVKKFTFENYNRASSSQKAGTDLMITLTSIKRDLNVHCIKIST